MAIALSVLLPVRAAAQASSATPSPDRPDALSKAYLFGAAFARSDLSSDKAGGVMFLPGRGLIRWETRGKTLEEQEELRTEAIGLADARAVQAEIDARQAAMQAAMEARPGEALAADGRAATALNLGPVTGTYRQAGGVVALNRAPVQNRVASTLGVHDGAGFRDRGRLYVFGAVSGRGVGMNLMHDADTGWRSAGLSTDKGGFVGQRQAGLALRRGGAQAAISFVQEKTRAQLLGITAVKDQRAMINFTFVPKFGH